MKINDPDPEDPESIKNHLDALIEFWREKKIESSRTGDDHLIAKCNIDAFQSVRKNIFGEVKD